MSDKDDDSTDQSLARNRSRRATSKKKANRFEALEKLKAAKNKEWKYEVEEELKDNVYDIVDERKYAERVKERLDDDFIVDDDGEYADDGREIFDDDEEDGEGGSYSGPRKAAKEKKKKEEAEKKKRGNIKNMLLNMPSTKRNEAKDSSDKNKKDDVLESLLGELKSETKAVVPKRKAATGTGKAQVPFSRPRPIIEPKRMKVGRKIVTQVEESQEMEDDSALSMLDEASTEDFNEKDDTPSATQNIEEVSEADLSAMMEEEFIDDATPTLEIEAEKTKSCNRGFLEDRKAEANKTDLSNWSGADGDFSKEKEAVQVDIKLESGTLPLIENEKGQKVLRMYWIDAYEDMFKHPGTVWLFGKVYVESVKSFASCCLTVKNIKRRIFLLKRNFRYDLKLKEEIDGPEVTLDNVYEEFNSKIAERYKIPEFKSKTSEKLYAFEHVDVPEQGEYLEVHYSSKYPALPSDLKGETFSRIFGANQSSLEHFLISRKFKGPSWIDVSVVSPSNPPTSWCKVEAICENPSEISVTPNPPDPPPLTLMVMNMKTVINPKSMLNEISVVSCLVHNEFYLDKAAPRPSFQSHFCAMTKPADEVWPFDLAKVMGQNSRKGPKIEKMDSERALLGFFVAKLGKIDPDIIIGHDITGFDIDVLVHRTVTNKIPHWSRLGRLKRSQAPQFRGKLPEKEAMTGRLVCDLKISAKELIRCKSYDLGPLVEKLLGKPVEKRIEVGCDEMRKAYENSLSLLHIANLSLQDAADTLQCIYELNALPLALQITQVAGNVMSRTLLGGRAERNEFLLLHAFNERNYICPDKQYGKKKVDHNTDEEEPKGKSGRRKPAYVGGLVLEPKKGFYDKFILLMDFNSLYPSIIQEYNICFTTVSRKIPLDENGKPDESFIPEIPSQDCQSGVLPTEIRKLVESRKAVKQLLKNPGLSHDQKMQYDIRQKALKLTANSMYGCLGFSHSRFFAKPLAALVTSRGREILLNTKDLVEKMNLEVIYGDTDSIMINTNKIDYDEVFKLGASIKQEVNKMYKLLELDVDGVYRYMLLLKKKKYAAMTMEMKGGQTVLNAELKGLDIVRRDWSQLAADAGKVILDKILSDCQADERIAFIHEKLEQLAKDLRAGKVSLQDLAITKQLTKNPSDYADKKALPHVQVAIRLNSKGGKKLKMGDTVEYVICEDGSNLPATQRAYHVDEVKEREELKIDVNYYLSQQLHPVVSRLCDPLEGTDAARIAMSLGLDPEHYRRAVSNENMSPEEESNMNDEEKYRECEKLTVKCECGEEVVLETAVRGMKDDKYLSLAKCPNTKNCKKNPIQLLTQIQNKVTLGMRRHISKFYQGYIICEDPACTGRTKQLPLDFRGAFPVCSTCEKAIMTKEYTEKQLYTQFMYYQHLFDVAKASAQHGRNFNIDLSTIKDAQANYVKLKKHVDMTMSLNKYSMIDMTRLFGGFSTFTAVGARKNRNS